MRQTEHTWHWRMVAVLAVALGLWCVGTAAAQDGPAKVQASIRVYASDIHDEADTDSGGGAAAISLAGTRNGTFSGKVVVSSDQPITSLRAACSDLRQGDAVIPASRISVRYGVPWDLTIGSFYRPKGSDILFGSSPAEAPTGRDGSAVAPVFVTVSVPKDARPGNYTGRLTVEAKGLDAVAVPITLSVEAWTLPDAQDWQTWMELIQSPDNLAAEYDLPLWSDRHWEMIGRSLELIARTGCRVVYVPLICHTNFGHEQSMVRWIPKGDGTYDHDFSVMDRYLDTAEKRMGRPKIVVLYAWDVYLKPPKDEFIAKLKEKGSHDVAMMEARRALREKGPPVTVLDPATGKAETTFLPQYEDPAGKALWQPLWSALRERLRQRGLDKVAMLGVVSDWWPSEEQTAALADLSGGMPWASCSHHTGWLPAQTKTGKGALYGLATISYVAAALEFELTINPAKERTYGWKNPVLFGQFWRKQYYNYQSHSTVRHEAECNITGNQRGLAHLGGDVWYAVKSKAGKRAGNASSRYPQSYWHSLDLHSWMLGPGPDGPVGTVRLELMCEGVQECEARIAIETALTDPALRAKLGDDLAARAQDLLDEQQRCLWRAKGATDDDIAKYGHLASYRTYYNDIAKKWDEAAGNKWFISSGWAERVAKLYAVAGEVAAKVSQ